MPSASAAIAHLQLQGLLPIEASREGAADKTAARGPAALRPLPPKSLILIVRQLSRLAAAGLPLDRALQITQALLQDRRSREAIAAVHAAVCDGASLADAMAGRSGAFPTVVLAMVRAGEQGGVLSPVLGRAAEFLERSQAVRQTVITAMIYPAILAAVAGLAIIIVLTIVLPEFEPLFADAGSTLPLITRLVMAGGRIFREVWWMLAPATLFLAWLARRSMESANTKWILAGLVIRLPLLGPLILRQDAARFARTLSALLANGVSSERALDLAGHVVQNDVVASALRDAADHVRRGEGLSGPLQSSGHLPAILVQLTRVGEETGKLPELLAEAAGLLEADVERHIGRILAFLVPALTIGMGGVIATIVAAVLLAMLSINDLAN